MDKYRTEKMVKSCVIHAVLLIVAMTCIFPLVWTLSSSLKTQEAVFSNMNLLPDVPQWQNYYRAWTEGKFGVYFMNSVLYTVVIVGGIVVISSLAAYAFSKLEFRGKTFFYIIFISTMMIPIPATFVAMFVLIDKLHLMNTRAGYILPLINSGLALGIFLLKTFFDKTPKEAEDSACIDGCNKFGMYFHVALPLARPAIAVVVIFNTLTVWNEYFWANLVFNDYRLMPLQRGLIMFHGPHFTEYPLLMAAIVITIVPVVIVYLIMQKSIVKGIATGALKG